jgi:hypothetical protein
MSGFVKDYQMPAIELGLADYLGVWGRRQIILRGGNHGVFYMSEFYGLSALDKSAHPMAIFVVFVRIIKRCTLRGEEIQLI